MNRHLSLSIVGALCLLATPAFAAPILAFVSGQGVDGPGCGSTTSPCRTLQFAHDAVADAGIVALRDPGEYDGLYVNKPLSIVNDSNGAVLVRSNPTGEAVKVNDGATGVVRLRGLTIDGLSSVNRLVGVRFRGAGRLEVTDCVIRNYPTGIWFDGLARSFAIVNTSISDASNYGVVASADGAAPLRGYIDNSRLIDNRTGLSLQAYGQRVDVVVEGSVLTNSRESTAAVRTDGPTGARATLHNTTVSNNAIGLIAGFGPGVIHLDRSTVSANGSAAMKLVAEGTIASSGNNAVRGNTNDTLGLFTAAPLR